MAGAWYKDFYLATPAVHDQLLAALTTDENATQNLADVQQRLSELNEIPEERCVISSAQRRFLKKVLEDVATWQREGQ